MADRHRRRRVKSDDDSDKSFSESDVEAEDTNDAENSFKGTPEKENFVKAAEGSEYESVEEEEAEDKAAEKTCEESRYKDSEVFSELVDEEGGEEGIAETEDVDGDFLSGDNQDECSEDGEYVEEERQQGDGEECSPCNAVLEKELDFDEDRRNPQYIPKKGIFYEHDDRNNEDVEEKEEEPTRDRKKKLWLDEGKWGHDRFREEEQYPKSRHELIETYGYDIRNEDGPPRARRRRRYGRGPTKYERSWEDLTAYGKEKFKSPPRGFPRGRRSQGGHFRGGPRFRGRGRIQYDSQSAEKNEVENVSATEEVPVENEIEKDSAVDDNVPVINNNEFPALPTKDAEPEVDVVPEKSTFFVEDNFIKSSPEPTENKTVRTLTFENSNLSNRNSLERESPPRRGKTPPFGGNYNRGNRKPNPRGNRGSGRGEYNRRGRGNMRHISPRFMENKVNNLNVEIERLSIDEVSDPCNGIHSEALRHNESNGIMPSHTNGVEMSHMALKGAGDSSGRPKRYSSMRQRSLPETNAYQAPPQPVPPPHPPPTYYKTGYQPTLYASTDTCVLTPSTQSQTITSPPIMNPPTYQTFPPTPYTDSYGVSLQMPVTTPPPRLFTQANVPAGQPILAPPPCITPSPSIINFAPPPPPTGYHQFAYQQYATPPPPPVSVAPELMAPPSDMFQAGITYYYPQSQPPTVRPTVQKRPKAAIPILPPPEREVKRSERKDSSQSGNSNSRNFSDSSSEPVNVDMSLRTESSQLQTSVGVES